MHLGQDPANPQQFRMGPNGYNFDVAYHVNTPMVWFTPGQHTKLGLCGVLLAASKLHNMIPGYSWVEMD